ncbi:MAG: 1-acyl-sn-glycerol-3-phosphate acyltransferase [Clostridia bacterium]|nr:1-acyl-sn-glycerol-3-phosphate acyltransferase [Clostridia bacterium]
MAKRSPKQQRLNKRDSVERTRFYRFFYAVFAPIIGLLFRIKVVGGENEPLNGGYVVCSNHIAASDPIMICYALRHRQLRLMAKKELFSIPFLAPLIRSLGAFPIDRKGNDVGAIRHGVELVKQGRCLCIFPQGHRYPGVDPRTTKVKNGAALIASRANADILPVYVLRKDNRPKLFGGVTVVIGKPFSLSEIVGETAEGGEYARLSAAIFDRICALGEQARAEQEKGEQA